MLIGHLVVNVVSPYGFHRDEFLYLAMGRHLRLFAMDFPPFIAIAARATLETIGGSLIAVRLLPAVAAAILVLAAGWIARRLGGGAFAQGTAALAVAACPLFMRSGSLLQPVVFDQLWWTLALVALMRIPTRHAPADTSRDGSRAWLLLGVLLGFGLLTKFSIAFVGIGITAAVLLTPLRRWLLTPWPWLAFGLALAIGSPSIIGQIRLGYPVIGQMADLRGAQLERIGPAAFLAGNLEFLGPLALLALAGLAELLRRGRAPGERAAGWAIVAAFLLLMALRGKAYYVGPIYPMLFGAGAVWLESRARLLAARGERATARAALVRWVPVGVIAAYGVATLPFGVPVLPPEQMARYTAAVGLGGETNTGERIALPQDYADMLGWEEQAAATARAYEALTPAEREAVVVIGTNYGRAGAHDHLGTRLGLPPAVSPIGSYWFFGPGTKPGDLAIVIGGEREELLPFYEEITLRERIGGELRVPEEQDVAIWIARAPRVTLQQVWPELAGQH